MKQKTKIKVMFIHRRSAMKKKSIYVNQIGSHIRETIIHAPSQQ